MTRRKSKAGDYLEPITSTVKRKKFCCLDIESKDGNSQKAGFTRPFLVGVFDPMRQVYQEFRDEPHLKRRRWQDRYTRPGGCMDKTLSYLLSHPFAGYNIYAHNGGAFDHLFVLPWLEEHQDEYGFEVIPVQSSIQAIKVWRLPEDPETPIRERWTFLDSMKLFPSSLQKMLETFKLGGKVKHDLNMHEDDPSWSIYLKQDCVGLASGLLEIHDLIENKLGGEIGMTAPSTSMKLFRRRFLGRDGSVPRIPRFRHWPDCESKDTCGGCFHEWVRKGYFGGRTELFRTFGERLHYYDINSSYVAAMREDMPVGDRYVTDTLDWRMAKDNAGFVECEVYIPPECEIPPLPVKAANGKLMFPAGRFSGVWTTRELELLDDPFVKGKILNVRRVAWFKLKPVFKGMVDELWRLRDKTQEDYDDGLSALAKLMGNSLYGKFGMKEERTSIVFRDVRDDEHCFLCQSPLEGNRLLDTSVMCLECEGSKPASDESSDVWYQSKKVEAAYIIPHIAAYITSLARVRIWRFMKDAVEAGGHIVYSDTDSIITDAMLPSSPALGALKDEYPLPGAKAFSEAHAFDTVEQAKFWVEAMLLRVTAVQPKVYMLERGPNLVVHPETKQVIPKPAKVTMKGFPQKLRTQENLERLQAGEELSYENLEKIRTLAGLGFRRGPQMRTVKKSFKSAYDKRVILEDGIRTKAVVLDEPAPWMLDDVEAAE